MPFIRPVFLTASLLSTAALSIAPAWAAPLSCEPRPAQPLEAGTITFIEPGAGRSFAVTLEAREGIIIDLDSFETVRSTAVAEAAAEAAASMAEAATADAGAAPVAKGLSLALCDGRGAVISPSPIQIFDDNEARTQSGTQLRFVAETPGRYVIAVGGDDEPRELFLRRRPAGAMEQRFFPSRLGRIETGTTSNRAPVVYSFTAEAGQWVEFKAVSGEDTLLRLAGPDRLGDISILQQNDDSDGHNPMIRRRIRAAGTYYVQVDAFSSDPAGFQLSLKAIAAPKPSPPPPVLRAGSRIDGRLTNEDNAKLYALDVVAGRSYQLELDSRFDGVLSVGLLNPVRKADEEGGDARESAYLQIGSQDENLGGIERLVFDAASSGQLLVRVRGLNLDGDDDRFTLTATDLGN